jgi:hypothetical protein
MKLLSSTLQKSTKAFALLLTALGLLTPFAAFAQYGYGPGGPISVTSVPDLFTLVLYFLNGYVVPVIFAIAFIMFLFGVYNYFIAGGASEEKQGQGKQFVLWSIIGFVLMFSIWGLINIFINTFALDNYQPALPGFNAIISAPQQQQQQDNSFQSAPAQPAQNASVPSSCPAGDYFCQTVNNSTN